MKENNLEFDSQIWTIFSIGVVSSVIILYYVLSGKENSTGLKALALISGFAILIYSFCLVLGYQVKQKIVQKNSKLEEELDKIWYPRAKFMAEIILLGFILAYFFAFFRISSEEVYNKFIKYCYTSANQFWWTFIIPILVLAIFIILVFISNRLKNKGWRSFKKYLSEYIRG
ncbi:MAG: hypothetical protein AABW63_00440 [Nanoarchaeota archaeon]